MAHLDIDRLKKFWQAKAYVYFTKDWRAAKKHVGEPVDGKPKVYITNILHEEDRPGIFGVFYRRDDDIKTDFVPLDAEGRFVSKEMNFVVFSDGKKGKS